MTALIYLSARSIPHARVGRQVFVGYAGRAVLNPTSATPQFPIGTIVKVYPAGRVLVDVTHKSELAQLT